MKDELRQRTALLSGPERLAPRSTQDLDLMTLDLRVLDVAFWKDLAGAERARRGEADDPLSGVVRLESAGAYLEAIATMELPAIDWKCARSEIL